MEANHEARPVPEFTGAFWEPERPIPEEIYPVIDTDLARDNLENDIPAADLEDLGGKPF